jgi:hypothetical protein
VYSFQSHQKDSNPQKMSVSSNTSVAINLAALAGGCVIGHFAARAGSLYLTSNEDKASLNTFTFASDKRDAYYYGIGVLSIPVGFFIFRSAIMGTMGSS